jgi:hypothetical protein
LTISHLDENSGPLFHFSVSQVGQTADALYFNYALYDTSTKAWDDWIGWKIVNSTSGLMGTDFQAREEEGKSQIVFAVYAKNGCGNSSQARESSTNTGVVLFSEKSLKDLNVKNQVTLDNLMKSLNQSISDYPLAYELISIKLQAPTLPILTGDPDQDAAPIQSFVGAINKWSGLLSKSVDKAVADAADKAAADKAAADAFAAKQAAEAAKAAAMKKTTITCIKGKLTKTVTAVKPVCPAGYKKK